MYVTQVSLPLNYTINYTGEVLNYTRSQIILYRMFFADFSVNSQPIFMKFCMDYLRVGKYCIAKKLGM